MSNKYREFPNLHVDHTDSFATDDKVRDENERDLDKFDVMKLYMKALARIKKLELFKDSVYNINNFVEMTDDPNNPITDYRASFIWLKNKIRVCIDKVRDLLRE